MNFTLIKLINVILLSLALASCGSDAGFKEESIIVYNDTNHPIIVTYDSVSVDRAVFEDDEDDYSIDRDIVVRVLAHENVEISVHVFLGDGDIKVEYKGIERLFDVDRKYFDTYEIHVNSQDFYGFDDKYEVEK